MNELRRATALLFRRMRIDLRSAGGHGVRAFAAACLLFTIFSAVQSGISLGAPGLMVYGWIVWVDSLLISIASVTIFASIIASEREQGTLSLLRMTGIHPLSLILGQGVSGVAIGCLLLAVQIPFVVLTITLGGVLWDQVLATFLALLAHLVLCAGLGLFWSVVCSRASSASFCTLLSLLALWMGTWFSRLALNGLAAKGWITSTTETMLASATMWLDTRLVWTQLAEISTSFGITALVSPQFWWSSGAGAILLGVAAVLLDRRPLETPAHSPINIRLWKTSGSRAWHSLAIAGKDYRQFMGGVKGMTARLILYPLVPLGIVFAIVTFSSARLSFQDVVNVVVWFSLVLLSIEMSAIGSRLFRNEIVEQTWSSLAVLPRWRPGIVVEKLLGAGLGLIPGFLVLVVSGICSNDVQYYLFGPAYFDNSSFIYLLLIQPLLWVSVTSLASMLLVGLPPTVTIFCGLVAILINYCLLVMLAMLVVGPRLSFQEFVTVNLMVTVPFSVLCLGAALVRLRTLTERN